MKIIKFWSVSNTQYGNCFSLSFKIARWQFSVKKANSFDHLHFYTGTRNLYTGCLITCRLTYMQFCIACLLTAQVGHRHRVVANVHAFNHTFVLDLRLNRWVTVGTYFQHVTKLCRSISHSTTYQLIIVDNLTQKIKNNLQMWLKIFVANMLLTLALNSDELRSIL